MKKEILYYLEFFKDSVVNGVVQKITRKTEPPRLIDPPTQSGWTESFDGTRIYWELHKPENNAHKPPAVFCYGLVCSMNQWRKQIERYKKERPVILFDYRGHHKSETPKDIRQINISALARDLGSVLNALDMEKPVHVWGHSMGVNVAIEFAVQEPKRVKSLVLCCGSPTNPFSNMFDSNLLDKMMNPLLGQYEKSPQVFNTLWSLFLLEPRMAEWVSMIAGFNAKASDKKDIEVYARAVASIEPKVFFSLLTNLSKGNTQNILAQVKAPALVIAGAQDHITPIRVQKSLAGLLNTSEYTEIPLGSHNVQLDFGEYVCLKAEEFWQKNKLEEESTQPKRASKKKSV
jgi:pimeloyl-ACP methyl ester carboxylesterase